MGVGFPHRPGRYQLGDHRIRPRPAGVEKMWKDFRSVDGAFASPSAAASRRWPWGNFFRCFLSRLPAQPLGLTFNDTLGPNPNRMPLYPTRYVP